jgi:hypothetical protein
MQLSAVLNKQRFWAVEVHSKGTIIHSFIRSSDIVQVRAHRLPYKPTACARLNRFVDAEQLISFTIK